MEKVRIVSYESEHVVNHKFLPNPIFTLLGISGKCLKFMLDRASMDMSSFLVGNGVGMEGESVLIVFVSLLNYVAMINLDL